MKNKMIILKNSMGEKIAIQYRLFQVGDEKGMIQCMQDEYGETYFKQDFYREEVLQEENKSGHICFLIAETKNGEIAGMMALKSFAPQETMCEVASQIFRKKYRGYGMAFPFFEYGLEQLKRKPYSAGYCLPVLFHNITQRLLKKLGFIATGMFLDVFDMDKITHSYQNGKNKKHSQGIQILPLKKKDAGNLFLPQEHIAYCKKIYRRLGVTCQFVQKEDSIQKMLSESIIFQKKETMQSYLELTVLKIGFDFQQRLDVFLKQNPLIDKSTMNVLINCNDENAVYAYEVLKDNGFFFTGLKPLCSDKEYFIMHNCGQIEISFDDYVLSDEFLETKRYIQQCYKDRNI